MAQESCAIILPQFIAVCVIALRVLKMSTVHGRTDVDWFYYRSWERLPPKFNDTQQLTVQWPFISDNPRELQPQLSERLTQYATLIVLEFLTNTPNLQSQSTSGV